MKKTTKAARRNTDIQDDPRDQKRLQGDEASLNLPDADDIPGQKNINPAPLGSMADDSIASDDEEGNDVFADEDQTGVSDLNRSNVSRTEKKLLEEAFDPESTEDEPIDQLTLDKYDSEGEPLEENSLDNDLFGEDMDNNIVEEEEEEDEGENEEKQE